MHGECSATLETDDDDDDDDDDNDNDNDRNNNNDDDMTKRSWSSLALICHFASTKTF